MGRVQVFCLATITLILVGYLLWMGQAFFLPLVCAGLVAYLILSATAAIQQVKVGHRALPYWLAITFSCILFVTATNIFGKLMIANVSALTEALPRYQEQLASKLEQLLALLGLPPADYSQLLEKVDFVWMSTVLLRMVTDLASSAGLISIYLIFILIESKFFHAKIEALFPDSKTQQSNLALIDTAIEKINTYIRIKTFVSALTGVFSYCVLLAIGVDFAAFCALLIFMFNFIPTLGAIIATLVPCLLALVQFDTYAPLVFTAIGLTAIQFVLGNLVEPRLMGKSFNMSGLVIIVSLVLWGYIWGIIGMLLSVPIMVVISIALANFKQTRWIAILMSQDGRIA